MDSQITLEGNVEDFKALYKKIGNKKINEIINLGENDITDWTEWGFYFLLNKAFNDDSTITWDKDIKITLGDYFKEYEDYDVVLEYNSFLEAITIHSSLISEYLNEDILYIAGKISKNFYGTYSLLSNGGDEYYRLEKGCVN